MEAVVVKKSNLIYFAALIAALLTGCASVKPAPMNPASNPASETERLQADINAGAEKHFDVLAGDDFEESRDYLEKAKQGLRKGGSQQDVLKDVAYGRSYLERAAQTAESRRPQLEGVIQARDAALVAGARNFPQHQRQLRELDSDVRSRAENVSKLSPDKIDRLQTDYLQLELDSLTTAALGNARARISGALSKGARSDTPKTLKQAELDLSNAENMISANRRNPEGYAAAVEKANESANFLIAVLATSRRPGRDLDEETAMRMVQQNRRIGSLQAKLGQADANAAAKAQKLQAAESAVSIQEAIDKARTAFTEEEAEVFQQGDKLLIRLKTMNFPVGRAEIPSKSLPILAKVKDVSASLKPEAVVVEGHTDATGSSKLNEKLSNKRASAILEYLETTGLEAENMEAVGYGDQKPITSNKSKVGRAQNRRVDIIVTPKRL